MLMDKVILGRMNNQSKDTKVGKHGAHIGKGGEATLCTWTWCVCSRACVCVCVCVCVRACLLSHAKLFATTRL